MRPCTFFAQGRCRHGTECRFSHTIVAPQGVCDEPPAVLPPCSFFAHGACRNGDRCRFSHSNPQPTRPAGPPARPTAYGTGAPIGGSSGDTDSSTGMALALSSICFPTGAGCWATPALHHPAGVAGLPNGEVTPLRVLGGEKGRGPGQLKFPCGVTVLADCCHIADYGNDRMVSLDLASPVAGSVREFAVAGRPLGLATAHGGLLVALGSGGVASLRANGEERWRNDQPPLGQIVGACEADGARLVAADFVTDRLHVLHHTGGVHERSVAWGSTGTPSLQGVAAVGSEFFVVAFHASFIRVFDLPSGRRLTTD